MTRFVIISCHSVVVCGIVIALTALGFAHRTAQPALTPELSAYVAAGGALSDICGITGEPSDALHQTCDACRITDSFALSTNACSDTAKQIAKVYAFDFIAKRLAESGRLDTARLVRAPPQA